MNTVLQIHLRPLRNRVAHGILEPGELTLSTDRSLERSEVERWLPLTKCFTRYLLKQEFPEYFGSKEATHRFVEILPASAAVPIDGVSESPTMSNIRLSTYSEFRSTEETVANPRRRHE